MIQTVLTILILTMAVGYALWRIYQALKSSDDPCSSCAGCALKELKQRQKAEKADCWHKK